MKKIALLICLIISIHQMGKAQGGLDERDTPNIIRATLLYNFAKLVAWPDHKKVGDFTISVVNSPKLSLQLTKKYSGKKVGDQPLLITSPSVEEVLGSENIHIVYIPKAVSDANPEFIQGLIEKNILIVTEFENGTLSGSSINFYKNQSQIKYEYDEQNAINQGLKIGVTLKTLGTPIKR
ncbi:MAG: YfiR family protein [Flavobacteriales bacterium]|nr:YfiR family protein [Flavobacteriales bacterium]